MTIRKEILWVDGGTEMRRLTVVGVALAATLLIAASGAWASAATKLCVPKKEGAAVVTPRHHKCSRGFTLTTLGAEGKEGKEGKPGAAGSEGKPGSTGFTGSELESLKGLAGHVKVLGAGIDGKPTIQFSGVNVQVVNGEGKTESTNGEGNLVIGYDLNLKGHEQTGSHDLVLGGEQTFTSYGGLIAGYNSTISAPYASVSGGYGAIASGELGSVSGGLFNEATNYEAWAGGGINDIASGEHSSATGGNLNVASGDQSSVTGGRVNTAAGNVSSIFGGHGLTAVTEYEAIP
jgi:hypothetical protein